MSATTQLVSQLFIQFLLKVKHNAQLTIASYVASQLVSYCSYVYTYSYNFIFRPMKLVLLRILIKTDEEGWLLFIISIHVLKAFRSIQNTSELHDLVICFLVLFTCRLYISYKLMYSFPVFIWLEYKSITDNILQHVSVDHMQEIMKICCWCRQSMWAMMIK